MKKTFPAVFILLVCSFLGIASLSYRQAMRVGAAETISAETITPETQARIAAEPTALQETVPPTLPAETEPTPLPTVITVPSGDQGPDVTYRCWEQTVYASVPLYIRSGPASNAPVIGKLPQGEAVLQTAVGDNGWSQIRYGDSEAYCYTTYLSVTEIPRLDQTDSQRFGVAFHETDDVVYAIGTNKLRSGPGFEYAVMGHLTTGSGARRVAVGDNGWCKLIFHDTEVFACSAYLTTSRGGKSGGVQASYYEVNDVVFVADNVNVRSGPGTDFDVVGRLELGQSADRIASGDNGWSKILLDDQPAYVCSAYLAKSPVSEINTIVTSEPELPTPNSPFLFQYVAPDGVMPFGFFRPAHGDESEPIPLLISLHGALEIGEQPHTLKSNFLTKEFRNWEYTGLQGFDAYVVCPQLTGYGFSETWSCPETADRLFELIDYLKANYNVDPDKISIEGHSLGGQGAIYMAADPRADFSAVILVSAYHPGIPYHHVDTKVRGFTGSPYLPSPREDWTSFHFMEEAFTESFGQENWTIKSCSHYDIPMVALREDADSNGQSDLIEWILAQ